MEKNEKEKSMVNRFDVLHFPWQWQWIMTVVNEQRKIYNPPTEWIQRTQNSMAFRHESMEIMKIIAMKILKVDFHLVGDAECFLHMQQFRFLFVWLLTVDYAVTFTDCIVTMKWNLGNAFASRLMTGHVHHISIVIAVVAIAMFHSCIIHGY